MFHKELLSPCGLALKHLKGEIRVRGKMAENLISEAAKKLGQRQTEAERILWFKLRDKQLSGAKFRRQEPIGNYIVDFVSFEKKVDNRN